MINTKITSADLANKGVVGLPDAPGLSTQDMQSKFDEIAVDVLVPKHNALIDTLMGTTGAAGIGSAHGTVADHIAATENPHSVTAAQVGAYTKVEADAQIAKRIVEIGSADMSKAVYDANNNGIVDNSEKLGGNAPSYYAKAEDAFATYTHSKNGTVHALLNPNGGSVIRFAATADFKSGDSFTVNGTACTAKTNDGETLSDGYFVGGTEVSCLLRGTTLNFKSGGTNLNFKIIVVASTTEMNAIISPKANTIAVISPMPLPASAQYVISSPSTTGMASVIDIGGGWIQTAENNTHVFNALKRGGIYQSVSAVVQRIDANYTTVTRDAYIYKAGIGWVQVSFARIYLFNSGDKNASVTGGYTFIQGTGYAADITSASYLGVQVAVSTGQAGAGSLSPVNMIDLTNMSYLYVTGWRVVATGGNTTVRVGFATTRTFSVFSPDTWVTYATLSSSSPTTYTIDVRSLTGSYYFVLAAGESVSTAAGYGQLSSVYLER